MTYFRFNAESLKLDSQWAGKNAFTDNTVENPYRGNAYLDGREKT